MSHETAGNSEKATRVSEEGVRLEGYDVFTNAPISERIKALSEVDFLQIKYARARDVAYDPEGWKTFEDLNGEGSTEAENRGGKWLIKLDGNKIVYKCIETGTTMYGHNDSSSIGAQLDALEIHCKENPEMAEQLLPKGFISTDGAVEDRIHGAMFE